MTDLVKTPTRVKLAIDGKHTMQRLEKATSQFEETIEETLVRVGFAGEDLNGVIIKGVTGTSFRGTVGVSVYGFPEKDKRTMQIVVQPPKMGSDYCVLCRLTIPENINILDLYELIMAFNQPCRYKVYLERKPAGQGSTPDETWQAKPTSWAVEAIPFSPHPETLADDSENFKIILTEVADHTNGNGGTISADTLINLVLSCCNYNPDHVGEEINAEVMDYFADEILPTLVEQNYFTPVEVADELCDYKLGPAAISLMSEEEPPDKDPIIEKARHIKLESRRIINESAKRVRVHEKNIKGIKANMAVLQIELDAQTKSHEAEVARHTKAQNCLNHAAHAMELAKRASKELQQAE